MAGRFSPQFLEDLLARIDIVDLIDSRVSLKASGTNFTACCPFHTEKTPSFTVNRPKQFYHCFGCGVHGDAIAFLMAFERLSFPEAVASLAHSAGVALPDTPPDDPRLAAERRRTQKLFEIQDRAAQFYARQLKSHPHGRRALDYLRQRGISAASIDRFRLGYAPPGWSNLPPEWDQDALREAGLMIARESSQYDRFRDRIMFPIRDRRGRTIGFGGRVLDDSTPKYLNSPETAMFKKHREVYGLSEALEAQRNPQQFLVVEGYLDVIALAQFGFTSAVATLGTAISEDHISLLFRHADELVFCFDGDAAGIKAAWKAVLATLRILPDGKTTRFLRLPDGHDPDSLVRQEGMETFGNRVAAAPPLSDYFFAELGRTTADLNTIEGRAKLIKIATPLLQAIKPGPFRQMMLGKLGDLTTRKGTPAPTRRSQGRPQRPASSPRPSVLLRMLSLLIAHPRLASLIDEDSQASAAADPRLGRLFTAIMSFLSAHPAAADTDLRAYLLGMPQNALIDEVLAQDALVPEGGLEAEFEGSLRRIVAQALDRRHDELIQGSRSRALTQDERTDLRQIDELGRKLLSGGLNAQERAEIRRLIARIDRQI